MTKQHAITRIKQNDLNNIRLNWCDSFLTKLKGFTFRNNIAMDEGLVLVEKKSSIMNTAIHMMFVFTDLAVFWLDADFVVVHKTIARPWRPIYTSPTPAKFVLELHPSLLGELNVGSRIQFEDATQ